MILFSWRTLTNLLSRHGWQHVSTATFVPQVKQAGGRDVGQWILGLGVRIVLALERWIGRLWAPFVADGLIVVCQPSDGLSGSDGTTTR